VVCPVRKKSLICGTFLIPLNEFIIYKLEDRIEGDAGLKRLVKTIVGLVFGFLVGGVIVIFSCSYYPKIGARMTIIFLASGVIFLILENYEHSFIKLRGVIHTVTVVICCQIAMCLTFLCSDQIQDKFNNSYNYSRS